MYQRKVYANPPQVLPSALPSGQYSTYERKIYSAVARSYTAPTKQVPKEVQHKRNIFLILSFVAYMLAIAIALGMALGLSCLKNARRITFPDQASPAPVPNRYSWRH